MRGGEGDIDVGSMQADTEGENGKENKARGS